MIGFSDREVAYCEYWLKNYTKLVEHMTAKQFDPFTLEKLINYEMRTRRRRVVLERMVNRLFKLRKKHMLRQVREYINHSETEQPDITYNHDDSFLFRELENEGERH